MTTVEFDDLVLVDVTTAAETLGCEPGRLKGLIRAGKVAAVMHGGRYLLAQEEIERVQALSATERGDLLVSRPNKRRFQRFSQAHAQAYASSGPSKVFVGPLRLRTLSHVIARTLPLGNTSVVPLVLTPVRAARRTRRAGWAGPYRITCW